MHAAAALPTSGQTLEKGGVGEGEQRLRNWWMGKRKIYTWDKEWWMTVWIITLWMSNTNTLSSPIVLLWPHRKNTCRHTLIHTLRGLPTEAKLISCGPPQCSWLSLAEQRGCHALIYEQPLNLKCAVTAHRQMTVTGVSFWAELIHCIVTYNQALNR